MRALKKLVKTMEDNAVVRKCGFCIIVALCFLLSGCGETSRPYRNSEFTYGNMKWHLEKGKTHESEVLETFGPPNITSTDSEGLDMWVYQKLSTEQVSGALGFGGLLGAVTHNERAVYSYGGGLEERNSISSCKSVMMVLKFNEEGILTDYRFRTSSF